MQIITIFQGASGSGQELAEAVAQALGYDCIDREVLVQACNQFNIPKAKLTAIVDREPSWWAAFTRRQTPYRIALQSAFCELSSHKGIVYHGHLGHELVPKLSHVVKVLLTAPMAMRVAQVMERQNFGQAAAKRYVEEVDKARSRRLKSLFGKDWRDATEYDLVINLGYVPVATAKQLILAVANSPAYQPTSESKQAFDDFALASRVEASLSLAGHLARTHLEIKAHGGTVTVCGTIPNGMTQAFFVDEIRKIQGVKEVHDDITVIDPLYDADA